MCSSYWGKNEVCGVFSQCVQHADLQELWVNVSEEGDCKAAPTRAGMGSKRNLCSDLCLNLCSEMTEAQAKLGICKILDSLCITNQEVF